MRTLGAHSQLVMWLERGNVCQTFLLNNAMEAPDSRCHLTEVEYKLLLDYYNDNIAAAMRSEMDF